MPFLGSDSLGLRLFLVLVATCALPVLIAMHSPPEQLIAVDFEVFGKVQGVFFRKYTETEANKLGLSGWCRNTPHDTVQGVIEGEAAKVAEMKNWLQKVGSPKSRITKAVFTNERNITQSNFGQFSIKR